MKSVSFTIFSSNYFTVGLQFTCHCNCYFGCFKNFIYIIRLALLMTLFNKNLLNILWTNFRYLWFIKYFFCWRRHIGLWDRLREWYSRFWEANYSYHHCYCNSFYQMSPQAIEKFKHKFTSELIELSSRTKTLVCLKPHSLNYGDI